VYYNFNSNAGLNYQSPSSVEDANGNEITLTATSWLDTLNRTIPLPPGYAQGAGVPTTDYSKCTGSVPTSSAVLWNLPGPSGGTSTVEVCYAQMPLTLSISGYPSLEGTNTFMQSLVLPNGTAWTFEFDGSGNLISIGLPTGGMISYGWAQETVCGVYQPLPSFFRAATSRTVTDQTGAHTWTYSNNGWVGTWPAPPPPASMTSTVTDPLGNTSVHSLTAQGNANCSFYETERQDYQGAVLSSNLLQTTTTTYSYTLDPNATTAFPAAVNVVAKTIVTTWPNNKVKETDKTYDSGFTGGTYGKLLTESDYDYGSGAHGGLLQQTTNTYEFQSNSNYQTTNLINLPASTVVSNGTYKCSETDYTYDTANRLFGASITTQHLAAPGVVRGNLSSVVRQLSTKPCQSGATWSPITSYTNVYDTGVTYQSIDPLNNTTTYAYSSTYVGAFPTAITNALSQITANAYDFNTGLLTSTTDPNLQPTTYTYDPESWRETKVVYPDGGQTSFCYSDTASEGCSSGTPYQVNISKKITSSLALAETLIVDGFGRNTETELTSDPSGIDYTAKTYDGDSREASVTNPYRATSDTTYGVTQYQYDGLGRTLLITKPDNSTIHTAYCGPTTLVTDEAGHWRRSTVDGLGRLIEVDEPNSTTATVNSNGCPGTSEPIWVTTYGYDAIGDLVGVVQGGSRNRSFVFDSLKRLTISTNPEAGNVTYTYDSDNNVLTKKDGRSITITYTWDGLNRMKTRTYSNGDPTVTYTYDQTTCVVVTTCYNVGRRTTMTDASGSEKWAYDKMGREIGEQRVSNSISKNTAYTYNLDGSLATLTYPSGTVATFTYNAAGQPTNEGALGNSYLIANGYYTPPGGLMTLSLGGIANLTTIYNSRLQPCWVYESSISTLPWNDSCTQTTPTNGNILDLKYNFNLGADNGNVASITNNRDTTRSQAFTYDQVNRIVTGQTPAPCGSNCWSQSFTYDQWANLTTAVATGTAPPLTIGVNTNNQITTAGFGFDAAGNETSDVTSTYAWNAESEMKTGGGVNYTYDGDGDRVQKSNGKIYWYGAGSQILDESDASGNITDEYIYFGGKRVAHRVISTNALTYYAEDMLGSSRSMLTSTGSLCYDADFFPFGGEHDFTNTCSQNYKFMGKERDPETNNDDFGARFYASAYGRFLSADWSSTPTPVPYANLTNPQTLNLYAIVSDDPESFADLDGHLTSAQSNTGSCATGTSSSCAAQTAQKLADSVPPATKAAIAQSVADSNAPTADDKKGRHHEEGGMSGTTTDGKPFTAPAVPGPYSKPDDKTAHIDPGKSANPIPSDKIKSVDVVWHVHPAGGNGAGFVQPPSAVDISAATAPINIVVGAGNGKVYFYDSSGTVGAPISMKDFMKESPQ